MDIQLAYGDDVEFDSAELDATIRGTIISARDSHNSTEPEVEIQCAESSDGTQKFDHTEWVPMSRVRKL